MCGGLTPEPREQNMVGWVTQVDGWMVVASVRVGVRAVAHLVRAHTTTLPDLHRHRPGHNVTGGKVLGVGGIPNRGGTGVRGKRGVRMVRQTFRQR